MDTGRSISFFGLRQANNRLFNHSVHLSSAPLQVFGILLIGVSLFSIADSAKRMERYRHEPVPWGWWITLVIGVVLLLIG